MKDKKYGLCCQCDQIYEMKYLVDVIINHNGESILIGYGCSFCIDGVEDAIDEYIRGKKKGDLIYAK